MSQASLKEPDVHQHEWEIVMLGQSPIGVGCECGVVMPCGDPGGDVDVLHFQPNREVEVVGLQSLGGARMVYQDVQVRRSAQGTEMMITLVDLGSRAESHYVPSMGVYTSMGVYNGKPMKDGQ